MSAYSLLQLATVSLCYLQMSLVTVTRSFFKKTTIIAKYLFVLYGHL